VEPARAPRFALRLAMKYRPVGQASWREATTENISRSGVLFRAPELLELDTPIEMRVALPIGASPDLFSEVICSGRIVRSVSDAGPEMRPALAAAITDSRLQPGRPSARD
jgi:hypothetical protein